MALIRPVFLRYIWADKQRSESLLTSSGLNYVNVQPGRLLDFPTRGVVGASIDGKGLKPATNREDLAECMVEQIAGSESDRQSVVFGY
jgi:hypothetical protein